VFAYPSKRSVTKFLAFLAAGMPERMLICLLFIFAGLVQVSSFTFSTFSLKKPLQKSTFHRLQTFDEEFDYDVRDEYDEDRAVPKLDALMSNAFDSLKNENNKLRFNDFLNFEGMQRMFSERLMKPSDLEQIWRRCVDADLRPADFDGFLKLNDGINDLFGESMQALDDPEEFDSAWNEHRPIAPRFVGNTVEYLRKYFDSVAFTATVAAPTLPNLTLFGDEESADVVGETKLITFKAFADWDEISMLLQSNQLEPHFVKDLWQEALEYRYRRSPSREHMKDSRHSVLSEEMLMKISGKEMYRCTDPAYCIDLDTFLRLNYPLDEVVEDTLDPAGRDIEAQYDALYKQEFNRITDRAKQMTFEQLLQWDKMQEMLANEAITLEHLRELWTVVPKEYIPLDDKVMKFAPKDNTGTEAINLLSFIAINNEIQASLQPDQ